MTRLLQINVTANWGSHGRIAETIGSMALDRGWESMVAYGRQLGGRQPQSRSQLLRIGNDLDIMEHGLESRLFDRHGLASRAATRRFIRRAEEFDPDIIHLHNIHGYYLNYPALFRSLAEMGKPVVWTFHDCWPFTGHCAHFEFDRCMKWIDGCHNCPAKHQYPASLLLDGSRRNYRLKRDLFPLRPGQLTIVAVSGWLAEHARSSFLGDCDIRVIHNGVNLDLFHPDAEGSDSAARIRERLDAGNRRLILGAASVWPPRKGLADFFRLRELLPKEEYQIVLVGLTPKDISRLPEGIVGITRTQDIEEMRAFYAAADLFVNPTYEDSLPTTNIEAQACGTPVVTYRTGGSPETLDPHATGIVVEQGRIDLLAQAVRAIAEAPKQESMKRSADCRSRACRLFNAADRYADYMALYDTILQSAKP